MEDKDVEEIIAENDRIRHIYETQGDGPMAEQIRIDGEQQLIQQPNDAQRKD